MTDQLARATQVQIAYKTPVGSAPDVYALRVLSSVLQSGDSSRLYQILNKEKELVVGVGGFVDERIGPGGLYIGATVRPGKKAEDVEATIYAEIEKLQQQPIAEWELEKAKNTTRFGYLQSIRSASSRATQLGVFTVKFNDPGLINTRVAGFEAVTREDVQRVAKKYLQAKSRTVLVTNPAPPPAAAPGA
jgi:zinc protease